MTRRNDLTEFERAERYLEIRKNRLERELPPDGKDPAGDPGPWREYEIVTDILLKLEVHLRPPRPATKRRAAGVEC